MRECAPIRFNTSQDLDITRVLGIHFDSVWNALAKIIMRPLFAHAERSISKFGQISSLLLRLTRAQIIMKPCAETCQRKSRCCPTAIKVGPRRGMTSPASATNATLHAHYPLYSQMPWVSACESNRHKPLRRSSVESESPISAFLAAFQAPNDFLRDENNH